MRRQHPPKKPPIIAQAAGIGGVIAGSVTSVGLSMPGMPVTISGSPVTTSGTLTATANTQNANTVWAGPTSGGPAQPTFRALVAADLPGTVGSHALLDGVVDNDTLAGAPTRGALIVGNATPLWAKLAVGASGTIVSSNGTDTVFQTLTALGGVTGTGVATRVAFWSSATALSSDAGLFWDNTNKRLGIGTITPNQPLHIVGDGVTNSAVIFADSYGGTTAQVTVRSSQGTVSVPTPTQSGDRIGQFAFGGFGTIFRTSGLVSATAAETFSSTAAGTMLQFWTVPTGSLTIAVRATIGASGNVDIGGGASPALTSLLNVGTAGQFQVSSTGDVVSLKNVPYSWPSANAAGFLKNTGSGTLSWSPIDFAVDVINKPALVPLPLDDFDSGESLLIPVSTPALTSPVVPSPASIAFLADTDSLQSAVDDALMPVLSDLGSYFFLPGRPGGQVAYGGVATGDHLDLWANHNTTFVMTNQGRIRFNERIVLFPNNITLNNTATANKGFIRIPSTTTLTITAATSPSVLQFVPAISIQVDNTNAGYLLQNEPTVDITVAQNGFVGIFATRHAPVYKADGVSVVVSGGGGFSDFTQYTTAAGGSYVAQGSHTSFTSQVVAPAGIDDLTGFNFVASGITGSINPVAFQTNMAPTSAAPSDLNNHARNFVDTGGAQSELVGVIQRAYNPTAFMLAPGTYAVFADHMILTGSNRATLQGNSRLAGI